MTKKYYTVEQIAALLYMHPKTVQRYIREGRLRAVKIGKSWRVDGHDLSKFVESRAESADETPRAEAVASCVADLHAVDRAEAERIMNTLTAVLNAKPPEYGESSMTAQHIPAEHRVRVTLWGGARFLAAMLDSIAVLDEQMRERD